MTEHPIIFSAPMIRALLAGTKVQTRRVLKPQPEERMWSIYKRFPRQSGLARWNVGDRLWVREQWSGLHTFHDTPPAERESFVGDGHPYLRDEIWYWADGNPVGGDWERPRPSIHMPRWASRLTLTVTDVRVERVQDISEADAKAEGVETTEFWRDEHPPSVCFAVLWDTIHAADGPNGWAANPWVTATTFSVEGRP